MINLRGLANNLTQSYRGEWRHGVTYNRNDVVRVNGRAYVCKTDFYFENQAYGEKYKPEIDSQGWEAYSSGYMWTGQWKENGEYYPGDVINYNGDQYVCMQYGKMIHPIYDGTSATSKWQRISGSSNENKSNRVIGFANRNPMGWNDRNMGWEPGRIDSGMASQCNLHFINGNFEACVIGRTNGGNAGAGDHGWSFNNNPNNTNVGSAASPMQAAFQFWDFYDSFRTSSVGPRPRIIQIVANGSGLTGFLFDNGEVFFTGANGNGQLGDGGSTSRYYTRRTGRCSNTGSGFDPRQHLQEFQGSQGRRGQGILRDIQAIKIGHGGTANATNDTQSCAALDINGQLWTWGYNGYYALGQNYWGTSTYDSFVPLRMPQTFFDNRKIVDFWMTGGNYQYCMAKDEDGNLWGWGYNGYGQLGTGGDQYEWSPRKVPYDWARHGGIKKLITAGYNTYYVTVVLTNDGVLHQAGLVAQIGSNLYSSGGYDGDEATLDQFAPMQKVWWDRARAVEMNGTGLRSFWNMTDLYNDVEDFWLSSDQSNARLYIKQRSTGIIFGVGTQSYHRFATLDYLANENQNTGDIPWTNPSLQYPIPVYTGYSDIIDIQRMGSGNDEFRGAVMLSSVGKVTTNGTRNDISRARGGSPRSGAQMNDGRNKFPWEFDNTHTASPMDAVQNQHLSAIQHNQGDGWFGLGINDRLFFVGNQTWPAGYDQNRIENQNSDHSYNLTRLLT
jgi:hypothetical protein